MNHNETDFFLKKLDIRIYAIKNLIKSLRLELNTHKEERKKCLHRTRQQR